MRDDVRDWCDFFNVGEADLEAAASRLHRDAIAHQESFERLARSFKRAPDHDLQGTYLHLSTTMSDLVMVLGRIRRELHRAVAQ